MASTRVNSLKTALETGQITNEGVSPDASNIVLFSMMNFYKRRAERAEAENEMLRKKMKQECEEHNNAMTHMQIQLSEQVDVNHHFAQVNMRGARTIMRKHHAGMRLAHCINDLVDSIELVEDTRLGGEDALGCNYIIMHKDRIKGQMDTAIQLLVHEEWVDEDNEVVRFENEVADTLLAREIIDLTEETEEELSGEETETDIEF